MIKCTVVLTQFIKLLQTWWMMLQSSGVWCFVIVSCRVQQSLLSVFKVKALFFIEDRNSRCFQNDGYHLTDSVASDTCRLQFWNNHENGSCFDCWHLIPTNWLRIFPFGATQWRALRSRDQGFIYCGWSFVVHHSNKIHCFLYCNGQFFEGLGSLQTVSFLRTRALTAGVYVESQIVQAAYF